jgi:hypothetical protein
MVPIMNTHKEFQNIKTYFEDNDKRILRDHPFITNQEFIKEGYEIKAELFKEFDNNHLPFNVFPCQNEIYRLMSKEDNTYKDSIIYGLKFSR